MVCEIKDLKGVGFQITDSTSAHLPEDIQNRYHNGYMYIIEQVFQYFKHEYKISVTDVRQNIFNDVDTGNLCVHVRWNKGSDETSELKL